jgi:hypothetical protein
MYQRPTIYKEIRPFLNEDKMTPAVKGLDSCICQLTRRSYAAITLTEGSLCFFLLSATERPAWLEQVITY